MFQSFVTFPISPYELLKKIHKQIATFLLIAKKKNAKLHFNKFQQFFHQLQVPGICLSTKWPMLNYCD
jgi:hypothetical protein